MAAHQENRPSWLTEECPPWCVTIHKEDDHPGDYQHYSPVQLVPAVIRTDERATDHEPGLASDLVVQAFRAIDSADVWMIVTEYETTRSALVLSADSALRVADTIGRLSRMLEPDGPGPR